MNSPSCKQCFLPEGFPVGLRVLAVDDDLTCLKAVEAMLKQCQYEVTATDLPEYALKRLTEEKKPFDIVITDVKVGRQEGHKLLELVSRETDIPLIMMSADSEQKLVMEGIEQGAVAYLLKPVRIDELKTIWQHVYRRLRNNSNAENNSSDGQGAALVEQEVKKTAKRFRKEKDTATADDDEEEVGDIENEGRRNPKKPRIVWTLDLHKKFLQALEELGDKAFPKQILELMKVEGLSRENIASHLQKYRLFRKRREETTNPNPQANLYPSYGPKDTSYLQFLDRGIRRDIHPLAGPQLLPSAHSFSDRLLSKLDTPAGLISTPLGSASPFIRPANYGTQFNNCFNNLYKFQNETPALRDLSQENLVRPLLGGQSLQPVPQLAGQTSLVGSEFGGDSFLSHPPMESNPFETGVYGEREQDQIQYYGLDQEPANYYMNTMMQANSQISSKGKLVAQWPSLDQLHPQSSFYQQQQTFLIQDQQCNSAFQGGGDNGAAQGSTLKPDYVEPNIETMDDIMNAMSMDANHIGSIDDQLRAPFVDQLLYKIPIM